jgi:hypothetical protein
MVRYVYKQVMMMVAFHVEMYISSGIAIIITVVPKSGFNLFLLSVLTSLGLGHIAMGCHRMDSEDKIRASNTDKNAMKEHIFERKVYENSLSSNIINTVETQPTNSRSDKKRLMVSKCFKFTAFGKVLITVSIIASIFLVIAGVFMLTFVFHFKGLVGFILGSDDDPKYSLVTTGTAVSTATGAPNSFIVRWIQACFFGFGVAMPLMFLCCMLVAWVIPLRLSSYRKLVVLAEVANAWNAIDVFVVSVVAALFEIQQFAEFIIGDSCDAINELLEEKNPNPDGDNKCFDVTAGLLPKFWVLGLAAGMMMTFGIWLLRMAQQDLNNRREKDRGLKNTSGLDGEIMLRSKEGGVLDEKMWLYERNYESTISPDSSNLSGVLSDSSMSTTWTGDEDDEGSNSFIERCIQKVDYYCESVGSHWTGVLLRLRIIQQHRVEQ